jgi:hypothetical protein
MTHISSYAVAVLLFAGGCSEAPPPPARPALVALLQQPKFEPYGYYTGADTPEDRKPLQDAIDRAIEDIRAMPDPIDKDVVRKRLIDLLDQTGSFATEDRDEVGRYAVHIWRALGFKEETQLFSMADDEVLKQ